jgi:hypothetical protein
MFAGSSSSGGGGGGGRQAMAQLVQPRMRMATRRTGAEQLPEELGHNGRVHGAREGDENSVPMKLLVKPAWLLIITKALSPELN